MFVSLFWVGVAVGIVGTLVILATWAAVITITDQAAVRRELNCCSDTRTVVPPQCSEAGSRMRCSCNKDGDQPMYDFNNGTGGVGTPGQNGTLNPPKGGSGSRNVTKSDSDARPQDRVCSCQKPKETK